MTRTSSYSIVVAGLGGQGVNTLTRLLFELSHAHALPCQGAIFKGGAQKAGSIHSELKIFASRVPDHADHSNQILDGTLDLMLALEPYEAMRFARLFNPNTRLILNDAPVRFYSERLTGARPGNPIGELRGRYPHLISKNYSEIAHRDYGDRRMANLLMLIDSTRVDGFPLDAGAVGDFVRGWRGSRLGTRKPTEEK